MHNGVIYKHLRPNSNSIISLKKSPLISMGIEVSLKTGRRKKSTQVTASSHWFQNTTVHLCEL